MKCYKSGENVSQCVSGWALTTGVNVEVQFLPHTIDSESLKSQLVTGPTVLNGLKFGFVMAVWGAITNAPHQFSEADW